MQSRFQFAWIGILLGAGACNRDALPATDPIEQACADYGSAVCATYARCSPHGIAGLYPDLATCAARLTLGCTSSAPVPDSGWTPAWLEGCAAAYQTLSCFDLLNGIPRPACRHAPPGTRKIAAHCGEDSQCASAYCRFSSSSKCGTCTPAPSIGSACAGYCGPFLACDGNTNTCQTPPVFMPLGEHAACDGLHPCSVTLFCSNRGPGGTGTCVRRGQAADRCDDVGVTAPPCDQAAGLQCIGKTCRPIAYASPGQACGAMPDGSGVACGAGGVCRIPGNSKVGTCIAPTVDGAACDASSGPGCLLPATCINGYCSLSSTPTCP